MKKPIYDKDAIRKLCDGIRSSSDIAKIVGCPTKYVQRVMLKENLPRLIAGGLPGERNPGYKTGRSIDHDGYVLVCAPLGHPGARLLPGRKRGRILEHRLVMEQKIGRYLTRLEVVDHIDGNKLNNHPDNLRLFESNGAHLKETLKGKTPKWSAAGRKNFVGRWTTLKKEGLQRVDTHKRKKRSGAVRKQQILLAHEQLGKDHPSLLKTERYLKKR